MEPEREKESPVNGGGGFLGKVAVMREEHSSRQAKSRSPAGAGIYTQEDRQYSRAFPSLCSPRISQKTNHL